MGHRAAACALTRAGITAGERALLVHNVHDVSPPAFAALFPPVRDPYRAAWAGTYHLYQEVLAAEHRRGREPRPAWDQPPERVRGVLGTYDGSGWLTLPDGHPYDSGLTTAAQIEDPQRPSGDPRLPAAHYFFIKARVLADLLLEGRAPQEGDLDTLLAGVARLAWSARVQLYGDTHGLLGTQDVDTRELADQRRLLDATSRELKNLKRDLHARTH